MKTRTRQRNIENLLYLAIWAAVIAAAALLGGLKSVIPALVLFLVHNYLIANFFFLRKNWLYVALTAVMLGGFGFYVYRFDTPSDLPGRRGGIENRGPHPPEFGGPGEGRGMDMDDERRGGPRPPEGLRSHDGPPDAHHGPDDRPDRAPLSPSVLKLLMALLLVLANDGVKMYFRARENEERLAELQKENLEQQLEYLRYQINPHFFMNTLNNIHALVDIDPEQAKASIVELSRLMRYILYEGSRPTIPLEKETDFLSHYVSLMRMRYSDNVEISMQLPEDCGGVEVPPLVFVSFVENAFKHGISYEEESFIRVSMDVDGNKLIFKCSNSRHEANKDPASGIGLENVRKRLGLLYGDGYTLHVGQTEAVYEILAVIPIEVKTAKTEEQ